MHLIVFSHKPCWADPASPSGFATDGGFPFQMRAISELFDRTTLVLPRSSSPPPPGLTPLVGQGLEVDDFPEPPGTGWSRKLFWALGSVRRLGWLWRRAGRGDVVHAAVPGDVGFLGLVLALIRRRRRIFVRHCGTWGNRTTLADRLLHRLLVKVAGPDCVVFATGGGTRPPEIGNDEIHWIFSTSLTESELGALEPQETQTRLIQVGRLTRGKNAHATLRALAELRVVHPTLELDLVGAGPEEGELRALAAELGLDEAVRFHGNLGHAEVLEQLRQALVFVFPTQVAEGFPKAVLEALACGLPVIAPRVSVLPHLLGEGGGIVVDDTEPSTLAKAIRRLQADPEERLRRSSAARTTASRYTLEAWRDQLGRRLEAAWGEPFALGEREA